jgi:hypothetical protein
LLFWIFKTGYRILLTKEKKMNKRLKVLAIAGVSLLSSAMLAMAATSTFQVSAVMPAATGAAASLIKISGCDVNGANCTYTPQAGTSMSFGNLSLVSGTSNGVPYSFFAPAFYYAVDVTSTGGGGKIDVGLSYAEGAKPTGQISGLGKKTSITYVKVPNAGGAEVQLGKKVLSGLNASVSNTALTGGYFRAYVGVITNAGEADLAGQNPETFSTADISGTYAGTLTITYTLV